MTNNFAAARFCRGLLYEGAADDKAAMPDYRGAARGFADLLKSYAQRDGTTDGIRRLHDLVGRTDPREAIRALDDGFGSLCNAERADVCESLCASLRAWSATRDRLRSPTARKETPLTAGSEETESSHHDGTETRKAQGCDPSTLIAPMLVKRTVDPEPPEP